MTSPVSTKAEPIQGFILDFRARTVIFRQNSQRLTRIELRLLEHLFQQQRYLVPCQDKLESAWGAQITVGSRTVDSHIVRLRRKMRAIGTQVCVIETVWGLG